MPNSTPSSFPACEFYFACLLLLLSSLFLFSSSFISSTRVPIIVYLPYPALVSIPSKMAAPATGLGSDSLVVHDIEPVTTIGQNDPVANVTNKKPQQSIIPESYDLGAGDEDPTTDELRGRNALRRVSAPIPWVVYTVAFVELCERFSYYGTQVLCKTPTTPYDPDKR